MLLFEILAIIPCRFKNLKMLSSFSGKWEMSLPRNSHPFNSYTIKLTNNGLEWIELWALKTTKINRVI